MAARFWELSSSVFALAVLPMSAASMGGAAPVIMSGSIFENVNSSEIATAEVFGTENFSWLGNIGPRAPPFGDECQVRSAR